MIEVRPPTWLTTWQARTGLPVILAAFGLVAAALFALQFPFLMGISVFGASFITGAASAAFGALLGFLFGIPRTLQADRSPTSGSGQSPPNAVAAALSATEYRANTNLEQISDWLTKILVGVGLTQFGAIPGQLQGLGNYLGPAFGGAASSQGFALAVVLYWTVTGFIVAYVWTRLYLVGALRTADAPPAPPLQDVQVSQTVENSIRQVAATAGIAPATVSLMVTQAVDAVKKAGFLTIDSTPFLHAKGRTWEVPYDQYRTVSELLNAIFNTLGSDVPPYAYGTRWLLRIRDSNTVLRNMGTSWARAQGQERDVRPLAAVGILQGMTLEVIPPPAG